MNGAWRSVPHVCQWNDKVLKKILPLRTQVIWGPAKGFFSFPSLTSYLFQIHLFFFPVLFCGLDHWASEVGARAWLMPVSNMLTLRLRSCWQKWLWHILKLDVQSRTGTQSFVQWLILWWGTCHLRVFLARRVHLILLQNSKKCKCPDSTP